MAKKEKKIEVISQEVAIVNNNTTIENINDSKKNSIDDMTLMDLVYVEKTLNVVCRKYENALKSYDGSIVRNSNEYTKFQSLNNLHNRVISKMESELLKLI